MVDGTCTGAPDLHMDITRPFSVIGSRVDGDVLAVEEDTAIDALRGIAAIREGLVDRLRVRITGWSVPVEFAALTWGAEPELVLGRSDGFPPEEVWDTQIASLEDGLQRWTGSVPTIHDLLARGLHREGASDRRLHEWRRSAEIFIGSRDWLFGLAAASPGEQH